MLGLPFGEGKPPSSVFERFLDAMDDMPLTWSVGGRRVVIKLVVVALFQTRHARSMMKGVLRQRAEGRYSVNIHPISKNKVS